MQPANRKHIRPILGVIFTALVVTFVVYWVNREPAPQAYPTSAQIFAKKYPNNPEFISELALLRSQGKLKKEDELEIGKSIEKVGPMLEIPTSLLYCLLFQESRLDHLAGIDSNESALGLGQFSYYSFFEVNHQISTYTPRNIFVLQKLLGYDVRPIEAKSNDPSHPSSYFHIPTAVTASAIYLNNRYLHLTKLITARQILYDKNLLWILAAMAYNKGTRSVLSLWNETEERKGPEGLKAFLSDPKTFFHTLSDSALLSTSLKRIWPKNDALAYAKEWEIHAANISKCSTDSELKINE